MRISHLALISASVWSLSACTADVQAPSLLPRAAEKQPIEMPLSEAREIPTPADPALRAAIEKQVDAAQVGDQEFAARRGITEQAVAKAAGKAQGSEEWVQAQEAITALETARRAVRDAAAAIEALRDDPAYASAGNRAAIDAAVKQVATIEEAESAAVAALTARLD